MRKRKRSELKRLGDILPETLKKKALPISIPDIQLTTVWNRVAGPQIAAWAQPDRLKDGVLYVRVSNSVWMHELQFMKQELLDRLNGIPGSNPIMQIRFFIGTVERSAVPVKPAVDPVQVLRPLKSDEQELVEKSLEPITDKELQQIIRRTMTRSLLRDPKSP